MASPSRPRNERPEEQTEARRARIRSGSFARACMEEGAAPHPAKDRASGFGMRLDDGKGEVPVYYDPRASLEDEEPVTPRMAWQEELPTLVNNQAREPLGQNRAPEGAQDDEEPITRRSSQLPYGRPSSYPPAGKDEHELIRSLKAVLRGAQPTSMFTFCMPDFISAIMAVEVARELDSKGQNGLLRIEGWDGKKYSLYINPAGKMPGTRIDRMVMLNKGATLLCLFEDVPAHEIKE
ncbi:MAG: hypothetical protein AB1324_07260 [Candidatus Micrarchaeota archaeon]